jgi:hypothetical protein
MVLTKSELIGALRHEVNILNHLITKIEPSMVDYRPTPKQRSSHELLQYLTIMGPMLIKGAKAGGFDVAVWQAADQEAKARNFDQTKAAIASLVDAYSALDNWSDEDFRTEIEMFGNKSSRGLFIARMVLGGHAAYRTQLFLYLKSCGREELGTMNLWAGVDPAPAAAV